MERGLQQHEAFQKRDSRKDPRRYRKEIAALGSQGSPKRERERECNVKYEVALDVHVLQKGPSSLILRTVLNLLLLVQSFARQPRLKLLVLHVVVPVLCVYDIQRTQPPM